MTNHQSSFALSISFTHNKEVFLKKWEREIGTITIPTSINQGLLSE
jgi:hypothetical protein